MKSGEQLVIKVPASSANLGPGFDSIGLALNLYLTLYVEAHSSWVWETQTESLKQFPTGENHFICRIAKQTAQKYGKELQPCKVMVHSEIPLARGLGSSATAIVAGIELANEVGNLGLTIKEKLQIASDIEGHPDNVGASLYGGLVVGKMSEDVELVSFCDLPMELVAFIPDEELLTEESREVLPFTFSYSTAVTASATANVLLAALLSRQWELAGKMMAEDLFHQPYRKSLVPALSLIEKEATDAGAFGVALSGAGPTVLCFSELGKGEMVAQQLAEKVQNGGVHVLQVDRSGPMITRRMKSDTLLNESIS